MHEIKFNPLLFFKHYLLTCWINNLIVIRVARPPLGRFHYDSIHVSEPIFFFPVCCSHPNPVCVPELFAVWVEEE